MKNPHGCEKATGIDVEINEIKLRTEISAITVRRGSNLRKGDAAGAWKWQSDVIYVVLYLDLFTCRMLCAFHFETILWHSLRFTIHVPDRFARFCRLRTLHLSRSRTKAALEKKPHQKVEKLHKSHLFCIQPLQYVWIIFNFTRDLCLAHMIFRCAPCRSRLNIGLEANLESWRAIFKRFFFVWKLAEHEMFRHNFGKVVPL